MTFAPELTDLEALSNERRLVNYICRRAEHGLDVDIDAYAMTALRIKGRKVGVTPLSRALDRLEDALENLDSSYEQQREVPCE